ncbi:MAG: Smr/MutS family protein [Candidatus Eremiobacteraeota bacterium]|nr:Smr/MutS family protein [Candidatus Eremiobacteraeota bacterium]
MKFDEALLAALEFPIVLGQVAQHATCTPGRAAVECLQPASDIQSAETELRLVEDAVAYLQAGGDASLEGTTDVLPTVGRAHKGAALSGTDLVRLADAEAALGRLCDALAKADEHGRKFKRFTAAARTRSDTSSLLLALHSSLEEDGAVADVASAELGRLRRRRKGLHDEVREHLAAIVRNPNTAKLLSEPIVTVRGGRYVVPVRVEAAGEFGGVVHDQSASGSTVYIEPLAAVEANNRLRALEVTEEREIARILAALSAQVADRAQDLCANADLARRLDSICARARWALVSHALRPELTAERLVRINRGCHPLIAHKPVPLDVAVGEACDALIISGPNMGGKTVVLKTVGLFCLLAYAGIPVPAGPGTRIGWFEHIACVIGDEQSISADLSSFSAHLRGLRAAYDRAGPHSLVLVDELGNGTEPGAGAALAQAFIEGLLARKAAAIVTTHYTQLKTFGASAQRVANASMRFDPGTNEPTYLLAIGVPGQSLAFSLARSLSLDAALVARAEELLGAQAQDLERVFDDLAAQSEQWRARRAELERDQQRARDLQMQLRHKLAAFERRKRDWDSAAAAALEDAVRGVQETALEKTQRSADDARRRRAGAAASLDPQLEQIRAQLRGALGIAPPPEAKPVQRSLRGGDHVFVRSLAQSGVVSEVYDRDVLVAIGNMKTVVLPSDLEIEGTCGQADGGGAVGMTAERAAQTLPSMKSQEAATAVDLRGMRVDEAIPLVDKALDDASLAGLTMLRIVHGRGTGQLGKGVREFLRDHPQVGELRYADDRDGGTGVTVATLR